MTDHATDYSSAPPLVVVIVVMLVFRSLCVLFFMPFTAVVPIVTSIVSSMSMPGFIFVTTGMTPGAALEILDALFPMLLGQLAWAVFMAPKAGILVKIAVRVTRIAADVMFVVQTKIPLVRKRGRPPCTGLMTLPAVCV